jgi:sugar phosphate isomerase/epimerase
MSRQDEARLGEKVALLAPLEVRYHLALEETDLGDSHRKKADRALKTLLRVCRVVSRLGGRFMTIHVGLGLDSTVGLSWERTIERLKYLVGHARAQGVRVCLENLAWGWTARPDLFEKLVRKSGAWVTLDLGHARVSPSVKSQQYTVEDFVSPHPERVVNAHIYHEELAEGHMPPKSLEEIEERLSLIAGLGCPWWVLELREEEPLLATLDIVRQFLDAR